MFFTTPNKHMGHTQTRVIPRKRLPDQLSPGPVNKSVKDLEMFYDTLVGVLPEHLFKR